MARNVPDYPGYAPELATHLSRLLLCIKGLQSSLKLLIASLHPVLIDPVQHPPHLSTSCLTSPLLLLPRPALPKITAP